ncbi:MAG: iron export ABC transporter permease subunit FetB [Halofilum sp. (in: g-proteobacteria)]|nr:iron export ABC transporter permease subunit FetB [Halofilum sp. (in: g-proteobacteria)]
MSEYIQLDPGDLFLAAILLLINGALSLVFRLGLERSLAIAALRMVVQLGLVAFILQTLFDTVSPWLTLAVALVMLAFAGREIMARQQRRLAGWWSWGLGVSCMASAAGLVTLFALVTQIQPDPWYHPRFAIPLLGMILGNTMTGIALGLDTLTSAVTSEVRAIEARIALGHTRTQALRVPAQRAVRAALMPTINAMAAAGVVALPGMMTGQILAGVDPFDATRYQILIMFLIAGGTGLGAFGAVLGGMMRLTDHRHRLRLDRLRAGGARGT